MEEDNRRFLDVISHRRRIFPSIQFYSPTVDHSDKFPLLSSSLIRSGGITSYEECSRKGYKPQVSGVLQSSIFGSQKRRQLETGYRPVWPKQIHHSSKVQDGDLPVHQECYPSERLGSVIGSNRRLLSRNDSPVLEEIPSLHSEWKSTPVPGSSIRDFVSSKDLHQDHGSSRGLFAHARPPTTPVLRRLAATQRESVQSSKRLASHMADSHKPGAYSEYSEIGINSHERVHIRGNDVPHRVRFCTSPVKKSRITSRNDSYLFDQNISISSLDAITHGVSKCSSRSCYTWPTSHETTTVSIPRSVASLHRSSRSRDSYVRHLQVPPELVAEHGCLCERYSLAYPHSRPLSFHRLESCGMGSASGTFGIDCPRTLVSQREMSPYKQSRIESCESGFVTICNYCHRQNSSVSHRQHNCGILHSQTGGDSFPSSVSGNLGTSQLVPVYVSTTTGQTRSRETQCSSRRTISAEQNLTSGMDFETGSCTMPFSEAGNTNGRSVCNPIKSSSTNVCVSNARPSSLGSRRPLSQLESDVRVCIPSIRSSSGSSRENSTVKTVQNYSNSAMLASEIMVQPASELPCGLTDSPSSAGRSIISISGSSSSHEPRNASSARMAIIERSIRDKQFSAKIASRIAKSRRKSTRIVYDAKWVIFSDWCKSKSIDPECPTMNNFATFFLFLFEEKKLAVSTIKGYRSMLSNTLKFKGGESIGSNPFLSELIHSFELDRPITRSLTPKWDLSCVLWSLTKTPYEPLSEASLKYCTLKTVFLLAFATARRRSEIHAFSVEEGCLRFNKSDGSVSLLCQPGFLAKNQLPHVLPEPIYVPSLAKSCGRDDADRVLCPVRSLKFYLKRVEASRGSRKRLFLPLIGNKDISAATVSRWISEVIKFAYQGLSEADLSFLRIRPHELRALSSSWAFLNKTPLEDVLRAAFWRSPSTFSSFYLRSFAAQADNLHSLGPLVASQRVISSSS